LRMWIYAFEFKMLCTLAIHHVDLLPMGSAIHSLLICYRWVSQYTACWSVTDGSHSTPRCTATCRSHRVKFDAQQDFGFKWQMRQNTETRRLICGLFFLCIF